MNVYYDLVNAVNSVGDTPADCQLVKNHGRTRHPPTRPRYLTECPKHAIVCGKRGDQEQSPIIVSSTCTGLLALYVQLLCDQDLAEQYQVHVNDCRVHWFRRYFLPKSLREHIPASKAFQGFPRNGREQLALCLPVQARVLLDLTRAIIPSAFCTEG